MQNNPLLGKAKRLANPLPDIDKAQAPAPDAYPPQLQAAVDNAIRTAKEIMASSADARREYLLSRKLNKTTDDPEHLV